MNVSFSQTQSMRQVGRALPEQILAGEILQLNAQELEGRILSELEGNPALALDETPRCCRCGEPVKRRACKKCGNSPDTPATGPAAAPELWEAGKGGAASGGPEAYDPLARVSAPRTMKEVLLSRWRMNADSEAYPVGVHLIESLEESGYLKEPLFDVAERFRMSVPQVEEVLKRIQRLDPPGVGARNLRECLLLQCESHQDEEAPAPLALRILNECWDELTAHRYPQMAKTLGEGLEDVLEAVEWIKRRLLPYPAQAYRDSWTHLAPRHEPEVRPDVLIRATPDGFQVLVCDPAGRGIALDPLYRQITASLGKAAQENPELRAIQAHTRTAGSLLEALAQRRQTLALVMGKVAEIQEEYLRHGKPALKPLLQKTVAADLGIHESTVCRALANKWVTLPSGETVPASSFFDSAAPVREALHDLVRRENPTRPLTDSDLARLLSVSGYTVARRTVAKYRDMMGIPSVGERKAGAQA